MKQDPKFTEQLQAWLNTPDSQKDWSDGAILLLQLSGNQIMYRNISFNPKGKAEFIKGQLQKYLNFRLQQLTKEQVQEMQDQVDVIVEKVIKPFAVMESSEGGQKGKSEEFADFKAGKRADHDALPAEIQALYVENLDLIHRMRELHLRLRTLSLDNATCPDSERYPFLKEIIALDKRLHANWDTYDHFVIGVTPVTEAPADDTTEISDDSEGEGKVSDVPTTEEATVPEGSPEVTEAPVVENAAEATETAAPAEEKPKKTAGRKPKANTKKAAKK